MPPCLIIDTNFLMDVWLGREGVEGQDNSSPASKLLLLAGRGLAQIILLDFVIAEFEGTSRKVIRKLRMRLESNELITIQKELERITIPLPESAAYKNFAEIGYQFSLIVKEACENLDFLEEKREAFVKDIKNNCIPGIKRVEENLETNHAGMVRHRRGDPPDAPERGMKDCIIFEYVLAAGGELARSGDSALFLTRDSDFENELLDRELAEAGISRRKDYDRLAWEIQSAGRKK